MDKDERARRAAEQEARALAALESIRNGGDLGRESQALSDEFTDRHWGRFTAWTRGLLRRRPRD
ncbi:hypothetical protein ELQ92_03155 [Labedella populi]|uniref:Uncharacterized protein n=1 Tax=Labedella populi TaxID=2498850 RepID=A0A3S4E7Q3_9MICO|nr:hypothetical protein [Labedella populi]RWZ68240.1 hypothetical protein ELQ92_03155 [Labedella populi]